MKMKQLQMGLELLVEKLMQARKNEREWWDIYLQDVKSYGRDDVRTIKSQQTYYKYLYVLCELRDIVNTIGLEV